MSWVACVHFYLYFASAADAAIAKQELENFIYQEKHLERFLLVELLGGNTETIQDVDNEILPLLHFVQKLASNDNFDIVFRQVENLEAHIFKISVSICLAKHSPHFVIESLHGGIG